MVDKNQILEYLKSNKGELESKFGINRIALFGSFSENNQSQESDIDLLVDFKEETPNIFEKKQELKKLLKNEFQREVDICTIKYIKPFLKDHILSHAIYA